jgi:hypothetical protein
LLGINAQPHVDFDGLIELRRGEALQQVDRLSERYNFAFVRFGR